MTKKTTIIISILLITAAVLMKIFIKDSSSKFDNELISFFRGLIFGAGITLPLHLLNDRKKK